MWVAEQPDFHWPWLWRGSIYEQVANFDQALADYQRALEIAPDDREVRLTLGTLLLSRGRRPAPATEHFEYVLRRFPDDRDALVGLAGCRIEQGESAAAIPLLQRAIAGDPDNASALLLLGKVALEQRDPASAEQWLDQAVRQAPDDSEALHQLVLALRAQGKDAEADRLAPRLEALRKDLDRMDRLLRAIASSPEDAALRHEAGTIALRLGRNDDGVRWLESAVHLAGDHRSTHAALAEHFAAQNDPRAERHRRLAQAPEQ
jgi:cytochrome c-type biogenesis protein CcmH/NrfG